jgi:hypothetical protein
MKSPPFVERAGSSEHSNAASPTPKPAATATNFRRFEKNTLKALFDLKLPSGLVLCGCTLHYRERWWVGFAGRPYKDQDGNETWAKVIDFSSKDSRDRFQKVALAAALTAYGGSQSDGGA